ncbi:hypothetical protein EB001_18410 [bacterium]|nr:hypothetical protein [bacterium]
MAGNIGTGWPTSSMSYHLMNYPDVDLSKGLCANHDDPDLWFAGEVELAEGEIWRNTRDQTRRVNLEIDKAISALSVCKNCPVKQDCLELGMRGPQLHFGIYGETMPGERLAMLGRITKNAHNKMKITFAKKVRRVMKERGL